MTIVEFLFARIAEDEALARAATQGRWFVPSIEGRWGDPEILTDLPPRDQFDAGYVAQTSYDNQSMTDHNSEADAAFIAHFYPARMLAECEAKRELVLEMQCGDFCSDPLVSSSLRMFAAVYSDHPDFDPAWSA